MTLPRVLELRPDGWLGQSPAPELQALREEHHAETELSLRSEHRALPEVRGDGLEIRAEFKPLGAHFYGLVVRRSGDGQRGVTIGYDGRQIHLTGADPTGVSVGDGSLAGADFHVPFSLLPHEQTLTLHMFLDKCVLEVYVNGRACFTRALYSPSEDLGMAAFAEGGDAVLERLDVWRMRPVW